MQARGAWPVLVLACCTLAMMLSAVQPATGAVFTCRSGDVPCLIDAINRANANGEDNTITLEAGTYTLTTPDNETDGPNGLPSVNSTLTIRGAEAATTIIARESTAPQFRLMHIAAAGTLTLEGLTLQGGEVIGTFGGGIFNKGILTLVQSTLAHNGSASEGGGHGGGLYNDGGTVHIIGSTVTDNMTGGIDRGGQGAGGGVYTQDGVVMMLNNTLARNSAFGHFGSNGGGLLNDGGTVRITNSTVVGNRADNGISGGIENGGTMTLTNSTVADNLGRGIVNFGSVIIANSTIAANGGGIENGGTVTLTNSTVAANSDRGIETGGGTVTLLNTILALNDNGNCLGAITSLGTNLLRDPCTITLLPTDRTVGDPGLGPFTDDGIPGHGHFPLLPHSPAIDAGNNTVCPATDQLGQPRVGRCDIGSIEFEGALPTVNDLVTFTPLPSTFQTTTDPAGCPTGFAGKFSFIARLTAKASSPALTDLRVQVQTLTNGNLLLNADGGPGGEGALLTIPQKDQYGDGTLQETEFVDVPFTICL
jgi:hypothetical protein